MAIRRTDPAARPEAPAAPPAERHRPALPRRPHPLDQAVDELQQGVDVAANFERLFQHTFRLVFCFFRRRQTPPDRCQDLTQETFLRAYRGIAGFRRQARLETWLLSIARNVLREDQRRSFTDRRRGQEIALDPPAAEPPAARPPIELVSEAPGPLEGVLRREHARRLLAAIDSLPRAMRRCVRLRVLQGLRVREIAELLRLSPQTVKVQLFRARGRLRQLCGEAYEENLF